jgi:thioesterase domain-containing protein/acyl carrier protein
VGVRTLADGVDGLVAYVVPEAPGVGVSELSEHLHATLPPYMVPARYVFLEALPLTSSGKVDRAALAGVTIPAVPEEATGSTADMVAAAWKRVLGHDEFALDDDFFDVGGDSLLAAWVVAELGQALGRELPLSVLLEDSTVEGLATALSEMGTWQEGRGSASEILTLGAGRSSRALFMFHALGGEVFAYRELARRLTSPMRVLGVRWAGDGYGDHSIQDLARIHADRIRTVQPHGPYLLGGWSFGGVLAFEVARRLVEDGERVDFVGLVDANPVLDPITGTPQEETTYFDMLSRVLEEVDRSEADDRPVDVSTLAGDEDWVGLMGGAAPTGLTTRHLRRHLSLARDGMRAVMNYRPRPYGGAVELFQADGTAPEIQRRLAARLRESVAGPVRVHAVPGDHVGMLHGTNATTLAEAMDDALARFARRTDGESRG